MQSCELGPQGLSLIGMFLQADWVVKLVIIGLFAASLWSWGIVINKWFLLRVLHRNGDEVLKHFRSKGPFEAATYNIAEINGPFSHLFNIALREWAVAHEQPPFKNFQEIWYQRIGQLMGVFIEEQRGLLQRNMGSLASVGSTSPFVGLFGTVWGIMNSFQCIAMTKNTNLSAVAPGISEALFATAIGLLVAIPAVVAYNKLTMEINRYLSRLENFADELNAFALQKFAI